jgi:hypothetical protein
MKRKSVLPLLIIISFLLSANSGYAQNVYEFLRLDMSARSGALGGAYVTNNDDPDVIFYNPAGLIMLEGTPASFSFLKHLLDINLASISFSSDIDRNGRFGAAVRYANYGSFIRADDFGATHGEFGASDVEILAGFAGRMDDNFYYGSNVKFIYSGIESYSSTALALDLGLHYTIPDQMINFGLAVRNIGGQLSSYLNTKESLPLDVAIGVSKRLEHLPLRVSLSFAKLNEDRDEFMQRFSAFSFGAEFNLSNALALRLGYDNEKRNELKIGTFAGIAGFSAGLGVNITDYNFSYGFSSMGLVGALHRITVATTF